MIQLEFDEYKMLAEEIEAEMEKQIDAMRATLDDNDREMEKTNDRYIAASAEVKKCEKLLADEQDKVTSLTVEKDALKRKKVALENKCDTMEERLRSLEMEVSGKGAEVERLKEELIIERMDRVEDVETYQDKIGELEKKLREREDKEAELLKTIENLTKNSVPTKFESEDTHHLSQTNGQSEAIDSSISSHNEALTKPTKGPSETKQTQTDLPLSVYDRRSSVSISVLGPDRDVAAVSQTWLNDVDIRQQVIRIGRKRDSLLQDDDFLRTELTKLANRERVNSRSSQETGKLSISNKPPSHTNDVLAMEEIDSDDEEELRHIPLPAAEMEFFEDFCDATRESLEKRQNLVKEVGGFKRRLTAQFDDLVGRNEGLIREKRLQRASVLLKNTQQFGQSNEEGSNRKVISNETPFTTKNSPKKLIDVSAEEGNEKKGASLDFIKNAIKSVCVDKFFKPPQPLPELQNPPSKRDLKFITSSGIDFSNTNKQSSHHQSSDDNKSIDGSQRKNYVSKLYR